MVYLYGINYLLATRGDLQFAQKQEMEKGLCGLM